MIRHQSMRVLAVLADWPPNVGEMVRGHPQGLLQRWGGCRFDVVVEATYSVMILFGICSRHVLEEAEPSPLNKRIKWKATSSLPDRCLGYVCDVNLYKFIKN